MTSASASPIMRRLWRAFMEAGAGRWPASPAIAFYEIQIALPVLVALRVRLAGNPAIGHRRQKAKALRAVRKARRNQRVKLQSAMEGAPLGSGVRRPNAWTLLCFRPYVK